MGNAMSKTIAFLFWCMACHFLRKDLRRFIFSNVESENYQLQPMFGKILFPPDFANIIYP